MQKNIIKNIDLHFYKSSFVNWENLVICLFVWGLIQDLSLVIILTEVLFLSDRKIFAII